MQAIILNQESTKLAENLTRGVIEVADHESEFGFQKFRTGMPISGPDRISGSDFFRSEKNTDLGVIEVTESESEIRF